MILETFEFWRRFELHLNLIMYTGQKCWCKKGLAEVLVQAVMSLYESSTTKVRVRSGTTEEFWVRVDVHQGSVLSPLIFAIVVDAMTEQASEGLLNEILFADNLMLMSESLND